MAMFSLGKKPPAANTEFGGANVPISQVLNMKAQGMSNAQIANQLRGQGFSLTQIRDAMAQADIKSAVGGETPPGMQQMPDFGPPEMGGGDMGGLPPMPEIGPMPDMGGADMGSMPDFGMPPVPENAPMPEMPPMPQQQYGQPQQQGFSANTEVLVNELQRIMEEIIEEKWKGVDDKLTALEVWKAKLDEKTNSLFENVKQLNTRIDEFAGTIASRTEGYTRTIQDVNVQMEAMEKMMGKLVPSLAEEIKELRDVVEKVKER